MMNLPNDEKSRLIEAEWQPEFLQAQRKESFTAEIRIYGNNRTGLLVDISKVLTEHDIDIKTLHSRTSKQGVATIDLSFGVKGKDELRSICDRIKLIDSVIDIQRTTG
jgi:GTP pyrophosphokinase